MARPYGPYCRNDFCPLGIATNAKAIESNRAIIESGCFDGEAAEAHKSPSDPGSLKVT